MKRIHLLYSATAGGLEAHLGRPGCRRIKKVNRENEVAVVGIQLKDQEDLKPLITKLKARNFFGDYINDKPSLFQLII